MLESIPLLDNDNNRFICAVLPTEVEIGFSIRVQIRNFYDFCCVWVMFICTLFCLNIWDINTIKLLKHIKMICCCRNVGLWLPLFHFPAFFHTQVASHHRIPRIPALAPAIVSPPVDLCHPLPHPVHLHPLHHQVIT